MRYTFRSALVAVILFVFTVSASAPQLINYQGTLTDSGGTPVTDDTYSVTFTIYNADPGGESKWSEIQNVTTVDGQFVVLLGSVNPIHDSVFSEPDRFLGTTIGGDPELIPRTRLVTMPYGFRTATIDGASGGTIGGSLTILVNNHDSVGNAISVIDTSGNVVLTVTVKDGDVASVNFYDPVDSKAGPNFVAQKIASLSKDGLTFFGATTADTNSQLFANGDFTSRGQIAMGENSSGGGVWSTVFGFNNTASGDSSTVSGGGRSVADGDFATIGGGQAHTSSGWGSTIGGGCNNQALNTGSTVAGGCGNVATGDFASIAGGDGNYASTNAFVGGGQVDSASGSNSVVGGGWHNKATGNRSVVGGGNSNEASGDYSTVSGGYNNTASATYSWIGGGDGSAAIGQYSTVSGGLGNTADGNYATVAGGYKNTASGTYSFAAGRQAVAAHEGAFVWADASGGIVTSTGPNQFFVRASEGTMIYSSKELNSGISIEPGGSSWQTFSDSTLKRNIREVDYDAVLEKLAELPISQWSYKAQDESIEHIGPMAQDFYRLFGLGEDDIHISTLDPDGVSLAAIKALYQKSKEVGELKREVADLRLLIEQLIINSQE